MGIKIKPHKITSRHSTSKEWVICKFKENFILKYQAQTSEGRQDIEELITSGCYMRGTIDGHQEYFIIEKSNSLACYVPLSKVEVFDRHVEEIIVTETVITDKPVDIG